MLHKKCAIYTRKSSAEGLEQDFNSLDAQSVNDDPKARLFAAAVTDTNIPINS